MKQIERFAQSDGEEHRAVRLTFSYKGDKVKLIKQQSLNMVPPPSEKLRKKKQASGFWVEVSDGKRNVVYRRSTQNPIQHYVEVRSDDPDRPLQMQEMKDPSGIFTILIPDISGAAEIALFSSPHAREKSLKPAVEIGRFEIRRGKTGKEN